MEDIGIQSFIAKQFFLNFLAANVGLGIFNLIPIPPLDGSRILRLILPNDVIPYFDRIEVYGSLIVFAFGSVGLLSWIGTIVANVLKRIAI